MTVIKWNETHGGNNFYRLKIRCGNMGQFYDKVIEDGLVSLVNKKENSLNYNKIRWDGFILNFCQLKDSSSLLLFDLNVFIKADFKLPGCLYSHDPADAYDGDDAPVIGHS